MTIRLAETDAQIAACHRVVRELRPRFSDEAHFVARVRAQERDGYRIAYVEEPDGSAVAAAGFRILENLAWGRFLYVDDLVTLPARRSEGHGKALFDWLRPHAREGMTISSHHYSERL